ncbi:unnamed protein product, partial [Didymodactylos carnosus]
MSADIYYRKLPFELLTFNDENIAQKSLEKHDDEFLVLDWTGRDHVFREQDPVE